MAQQNNPVKFVYIGAGSTVPSTLDSDTIYFNAADKTLSVGSDLIANVDALSNAVISGTGDYISNAAISNGVLTLTKNNLAASFVAADGGVATNADITLANNPTSSMSAATKQYVDDTISGLSSAMHFIGATTTAVTNGGTETPTIDGESVTPSAGDVVIYNGLEFVWSGTAWVQLGDESSFALKTTQITTGDRLTGGGSLNGDVVISHAKNSWWACTPFEPVWNLNSESAEIIDNVWIDEYGHVTSIEVSNVYSQLSEMIHNGVSLGISAALADSGVIDAAIHNGVSFGISAALADSGVIDAAIHNGVSLGISAALADSGVIDEAIAYRVNNMLSVETTYSATDRDGYICRIDGSNNYIFYKADYGEVFGSDSSSKNFLVTGSTVARAITDHMPTWTVI